MSELALRLIAENPKTRNLHLDLGNCGLSELPEELFECTWLESLILGDRGFRWDEEKKEWKYTRSKNQGERNDFSQLPDRWVALQGLVSLAFPSTTSKAL